ncbi:MAG: hypothetical protein V3V75_05355 [Thermoguttaceae bacterium]
MTRLYLQRLAEGEPNIPDVAGHHTTIDFSVGPSTNLDEDLLDLANSAPNSTGVALARATFFCLESPTPAGKPRINPYPPAA